MADSRRSRRRHQGYGLVLGAGGVLGAAWMTGALAAVQARLPGSLGEADLLIGTSAGSVLVAALRLETDSPHGLGERCERYVRRKMTQALLSEVALLRDNGIRVTVLTPGPEDLAVMGGNLMDFRRREAVFETSLRTSAAAFHGKRPARCAVSQSQPAAG